CRLLLRLRLAVSEPKQASLLGVRADATFSTGFCGSIRTEAWRPRVDPVVSPSGWPLPTSVAMLAMPGAVALLRLWTAGYACVRAGAEVVGVGHGGHHVRDRRDGGVLLDVRVHAFVDETALRIVDGFARPGGQQVVVDRGAARRAAVRRAPFEEVVDLAVREQM